MKIVITGANSAVGQAILRCGPNHEVTTNMFVAAVRSARAAEQLRSETGNAVEVVRISYDDPGSLDAAFQGASAVIHLAGILVEPPDSTYEQANVASTRGVVEAAKRSGVQKIVLVSATGADETSRNRYYRTKGQAEALVRASGLNYTVLRAPLLLGRGTAGGAALGRHVSHSRAKLIGGAAIFSSLSLWMTWRGLQWPLQTHRLRRTLSWILLALSRCRIGNSSSVPLACWVAMCRSARFQSFGFRCCWPSVSASVSPGFRGMLLK